MGKQETIRQYIFKHLIQTTNVTYGIICSEKELSIDPKNGRLIVRSLFELYVAIKR